jgi:hypothetical protein
MATVPSGEKVPLPPQSTDVDVASLTPLSHEVILRQATINIGSYLMDLNIWLRTGSD